MPVRRRYRLTWCYLFMMIMAFYFIFIRQRMDTKILVSTNTVKLPRNFLKGLLHIIWIRGRRFIFIHFRKNSFDYFEKMIGDLSNGLPNFFRILPRIFENFTSGFSWNATINTKSFVIGVLTYLKNNFYLIYFERKIADFIEA